MTDSKVTWLPGAAGTGRPGYGDTEALNDIHALLTSDARDDPAVLADIGQLLARSGRPMVRARDIDAITTLSPIGWPVARITSGATTVTVRQEPAGPGLLIEVTTAAPGERDELTVVLDGCCLYCPWPSGDHAA
jgi:hypothetical protein